MKSSDTHWYKGNKTACGENIEDVQTVSAHWVYVTCNKCQRKKA